MPSAQIQVLRHLPAELEVEEADEEACKRWSAESLRLGYKCSDTFRPGSKKMANGSQPKALGSDTGVRTLSGRVRRRRC